ncbi:hypothetical protein GQ57_05150 [Burkholderia sp. MSh2]|uniref:AraC family transcriptional regulator n=1 Tax=Burkholderia paludis TaxID=1506587 RepID=A0A6J5DD47_9BURK|nr:hypothetical protein GQ57_05150 [Burkholderia sp. MSh2]CAB3751873.1 hypothetical protein LMG30113_01547 [Burkholderia paludis]VWB51386.1 AraC family transcriptional regulator [Burkholderia paludis]
MKEAVRAGRSARDIRSNMQHPPRVRLACLNEIGRPRRQRDPGQPVARIAAHPGFGGEKAFRRAFARWTGVAPSRFRCDRTAANRPVSSDMKGGGDAR